MTGCCVCGVVAPGEVCLWRGVYACRGHSWPEIVLSRVVFDRLRRLEMSYYQEHYRDPELLVWASSSLAEVRQVVPDTLQLPDGVRILVLPDDACPDMFAVDGPLAGVLLSMRGRGAARRSGDGQETSCFVPHSKTIQCPECRELERK